MIRFVVVAGAILVACLHDHYECKVDSDCDVGSGGRCELDHLCTQYDVTCPTLRRYSDHVGALSQTCFDGHTTPVNYCAAGQSPAPPTGCAEQVCNALPACCATGWSDACVIEAQRRCTEVRCDTRIALTATKGPKAELWDVQFDGATWTATPHSERQTLIAYLAPAPGETEPRLAGFAPPATLAITGPHGELDIDVDPNHEYHDVVSLDFDRDLRDTIVLDWQDATTGDQLVEVMKLDDNSVRELSTGVSTREAWGDYDHDAYPDGVAASGSKYLLLNNLDGPDHARDIDASITSNFTGTNAPTGPAARNFTWGDVDGDGRLDLVAAGNSLRIHVGADRIADTPTLNLDCEPVEIVGSQTCQVGSGGNTETASWTAAILPTATGGDVIAATDPARKLYRIHVANPPEIQALMLPPGLCPTCPYLAVIVRDVDGDHLPDVVAIDSMLDLWVALSTKQFVPDEVHVLAPVNGPFTTVRASVTGAPIN